MTRFIAFATAALLSACGNADGPADDPNVADVVDPPVASITLTEDLRLGIDDPLFAYVADVEADANGFIYVVDPRTPANIYRFDDSGAHVGDLGAMGEGPGEYRRPTNLILDGDSIIVWDSNRSHFITYGDDGSHRSTGERVTTDALTSVRIIRKAEGGFFVVETPYFYTGMTDRKVGPEYYRMLFHDGTMGDALWSSAVSEYLLYSDANTVSVDSPPFGRETLCAGFTDRLYCAWTESLELHGFTATGDTLPPVRIRYTPIPVTSAERQEAIAGVEERFQDQLSVADTRPALDGMASDDRGRLWLKVRLEASDDVSNFWIFNPDDRSIVSARVDGNVTIRSIRDGAVYATLETPEGVTLVVRYRIAGEG